MRVDRRLAALFPILVLFLGAAVLPAQETPAGPIAEPLDEIKLIAERAALPHLSGENPFILRESSWSGEVEPGKVKLLQVHLFKRNDYHFWLAVPDRRAALNLNLYNGKGDLVEARTLTYEDRNVVSLIASPTETGIYYLRLSLQNTVEQPQPWAVIYAYR